jgi:hypothetical protein
MVGFVPSWQVVLARERGFPGPRTEVLTLDSVTRLRDVSRQSVDRDVPVLARPDLGLSPRHVRIRDPQSAGMGVGTLEPG